MRIGADTIRMEAINMVAVAVPIPMYNYLISRRRGAIGFKLDKIWLILFLHRSQEMLSLSWENVRKLLRRVSSEVGLGVEVMLGIAQSVRPSWICLRHSIPLTH